MHPTSPPTPLKLKQAVRDALRQWHQKAVTVSPLDACFLFRRQLNKGVDTVHQTTNQVLLQALQHLEERAQPEAMLLRRSFLNNELDRNLARELNLGEAAFYRRKDIAVRLLAEALADLDKQARAQYGATLLERLELPTYTQLVGVEEHLQRLSSLLTTQGPPSIVALAGMGGIGKTTLADALMRRLIGDGAVEELGWVTAQTKMLDFRRGITTRTNLALTADALLGTLAAQLMGDVVLSAEQAQTILQQRLKARPHLIVIDNLETLVDLENLLTTLRTLVGPSKFLLTSRDNLFAEPDVFAYPVPALSLANTLQFIRQEAAQRNLANLAQATDAELQPIYETVGGNPLALRLVVGQLHVHSLSTVLDNLRQAVGQKSEDLYTYIYGGVWAQLDELPRQALLAMQLSTSYGVTAAQLAEISNIATTDLADVLETLLRLNLVDGSQGLHERRYTIHSLTRTFLREQVLQWH